MEEITKYYNDKSKSFLEIYKVDAISKIESQCAKTHIVAGSVAGAIAGGIYSDLPGAIIGGILGYYVLGSFQYCKHHAINIISHAYNKDDTFKVSANLVSDAFIGASVVALNWSNDKINLPWLATVGVICTAALAYADLEHLSAEKLIANNDFMSCSRWLQD